MEAMHYEEHTEESSLTGFKEPLVDLEIGKLVEEDITDLGHKYVQMILASTDPIKALRDITGDALLLQSFAAKLPRNLTIYSALKNSLKFLTIYDTAKVYINGLSLPFDDLGIDMAIDAILGEFLIMDQLANLGLDSHQSLQLLFSPIAEYGVYRIDLKDAPAIYLNDIEKDRRYSGWPKDIREVFKPTLVGQLPIVRRNLYTTIFVVRPSSPAIMHMIALVRHNVPIRFGFVFNVAHDHIERTVAMIFYYLKEKNGIKLATDFLLDVSHAISLIE